MTMNRIHPAAVAALSLTAAALTANAQSVVLPLTQDDAPVADRVATDIKGVKPSESRKFKCVWTFARARETIVLTPSTNNSVLPPEGG